MRRLKHHWLKHHCKRLKTFGTTPEYLFRDQGVGGSNPLSPTNSFQSLRFSQTPRTEPLVPLLWVPRVKCPSLQWLGLPGDGC